MKKFISLILMLFVCVVTCFAQGAAEETTSFFKDNWVELLFAVIALAEVVVRLTPTKKDDSILAWIIKILAVIFPNRKKGGGTHLV